MSYLVLVSCLGLATSTLSSCCACFQYLQLSSYLLTWKLLHKAEGGHKLESDVGTESLPGIPVYLGPGIFLQNL